MAKSNGALRSSELWMSAAELKVQRDDHQVKCLEVGSLKSVFWTGIPRGSILEVCGSRSSGRTSICHHLLAHATAGGEICAVVDLCDSFHPASAAAAGVRLEHLVWVRCGRNTEYAIRVADLLLHAGGFGMVNLDLCDASPRALNRIPLSYWHRFRRAIEGNPAILLICADSPQAKSCSYNKLQTQAKAEHWENNEPFCLFRGLEINASAGKVSPIRPQSLFLQTVA